MRIGKLILQKSGMKQQKMIIMQVVIIKMHIMEVERDKMMRLDHRVNSHSRVLRLACPRAV
jgi:hypothetical protein